MPKQLVMNHNGDTRYYFDANDAAALAKAEERFKKLTGKGPQFSLMDHNSRHSSVIHAASPPGSIRWRGCAYGLRKTVSRAASSPPRTRPVPRPVFKLSIKLAPPFAGKEGRILFRWPHCFSPARTLA
jgi:hypothetical protein